MMKLSEAYPNWLTTGGIITDISNQFSSVVPWSTDGGYLKSIDLEYYGNHSLNKEVSPLLKSLSGGDELTTAERALLASTVWDMFKDNWLNLWKVNVADYNPIENYNMVENEHSEGSNTGNINATGTDSSTVERDSSTDNSIYGFNSSSASNSDRSVVNDDTSSSSSSTATNTSSGSNENDRELTRSGNIGVTTTQQMIQSTIELYNWSFWCDVFRDIDKVLCCGYWE